MERDMLRRVQVWPGLPQHKQQLRRGIRNMLPCMSWFGGLFQFTCEPINSLRSLSSPPPSAPSAPYLVACTYAFGNLIHSTGTTPNNYRYPGEQYDPDRHLYYNRARYLNTTTGRFWSMDASDYENLGSGQYT
jgi:RHS repeat-associated protein